MKCPCCEGYGTSNTCINGTFQPCTYCNGTGEIDKIVQKFKNPYTNFQRITASPEVLAEFLDKIIRHCADYDKDCTECPMRENRNCDYETTLEWLMQESEE